MINMMPLSWAGTVLEAYDFTKYLVKAVTDSGKNFH